MITIILPVYNASKTILATLVSVKNQDISDINVELIIINDGSTDDSEKLITQFIYENKHMDITYIFKENSGVSSSRNLGISKAKYDWVAFIDSDDVWADNKLAEQILIINNSAFNIDFIGCARNDEILSLYGNKINKLHKACYKELLIKMFPQTSTAMVKKSVLDRVGGYDETMTHSEDGDLWIRICFEYDFYYMSESLVVTGGNKHNFGESGLSANLLAMEKGVQYTLLKLYNSKKISIFFYVFLRVFCYLKYVRRLLISSYIRRVNSKPKGDL
ncbi:glycosyltransferase family 2 protein [Shewanella psychromarinicola]|uniref:Glycosyltransferase family 2 protein n=1 Tax=Shewanella psychromarinicola TaxID=2487742 RepID=A0A3N4E3Q6_9GAMM|nr:glycosyltransferase family A protein [Shewanella psychromarinicola]AZG35360.1 glycosyltransferase family 2 protein [Shewanella psychromarinicola]MCL1083606.1 glycosyltransferase family 2 protein [Shewanella psychromarinicola]RPA32835.1 glycosyltransferase family 2 protein [Shewanella psychromarinicola]